MDEQHKMIIEKYLEQVKILTALGTTLLLTPNILLVLMEKEAIRQHLEAALPGYRTILWLTNFAFLLTILLTYFIYSSVVGSMEKTQFDIERPATRVFSIAQFVCMLLGCVGLMVLFANTV